MTNSSIGCAIAPVILSLLVILCTRRATLGLLSGFSLGSFLYLYHNTNHHPFAYLTTTIQETISNPWHYSTLIFTSLLGGFASLLQRGGGLEQLFRKTLTPKAFQIRVMSLGLMCFFDGLANCLLIGKIGAPMADRLKIPREKIAYIADTTSSAVACLAPISSWIAMQLALIGVVLMERGIDASPYTCFLRSIPCNFYCISCVAFMIFTVATKDFGPMAKATPLPYEPNVNHVDTQQRSIFPPVISILSLLLSIPVIYYLMEIDEKLPITGQKLGIALGGDSGPTVFIITGFISNLILFILSSRLTVAERTKSLLKGIKQMLIPLTVLLSAWLFSAVLKDLGLGMLLSQFLGESFPLKFAPLIVFSFGCLLSFTTGTSWGTMALLFPLVFGALGELPDPVFMQALPLLTGAIFSGAVFGDHCSPYSDTTIVCAVATECTPYNHVKTQLPYALIPGVISGSLFAVIGAIAL